MKETQFKFWGFVLIFIGIFIFMILHNIYFTNSFMDFPEDFRKVSDYVFIGTIVITIVIATLIFLSYPFFTFGLPYEFLTKLGIFCLFFLLSYSLISFIVFSSYELFKNISNIYDISHFRSIFIASLFLITGSALFFRLDLLKNKKEE